MSKHAVAVAAIALLVLLSACSAEGGGACTAIGWNNSVTVQLSGSQQEIDRVTRVELCDSELCSTPAVELQPGVTSPAPSATFSAYQSTSGGPGRWNISVSMNAPENVTIRAYDDTSTVIAERVVDLAWSSLSESTECPSASAVDPVELPVGA